MQPPFVSDAYRGEVPINWYPASDQDRNVILFGTPGLSSIVIPKASTEVRAFHAFGAYLYAVCGVEVYQIDSSKVATKIGDLSVASGPAWIVDNGTQIAFCDGANIFVYTPGTSTFTKVTDSDFPGASCLDYQDGYGIFINPGTQQFYLTALYDFTDIDALDYASAEGWPDVLIAVKMLYRELWLAGPETIEIWQNTGDTFPFGRAPGGFIHQGISAAGTLVKFDNGMAWLNQDREMLWAQGRQPIKISTTKMDREISSLSDVSGATSFEYADEGHRFLVLNIPGDDCTRVYDAATKLWHKRKSLNEHEEETRWRGNCYIQWNNNHLIGDYDNGKVYKMSPDYHDDDGIKSIAEVQSNEIVGDGKRMFFPSMQIVFDHGDVLQGEDPDAMLSWSSDGGRVYSNEVWAKIGQIGEYGRRTVFRRLGSSQYTRIFKLRVSAAINRTILGVNWI